MVQLKYQSEPFNIVLLAVEKFYWLVGLLLCLSFFHFLGGLYGISLYGINHGVVAQMALRIRTLFP